MKRGVDKKGSIVFLASLLSKFFSAFNAILLAPIYINYLGEKNFGFSSLIATLQAFLLLFGFGFSRTLKREFSKSYSQKELYHSYNLLKSCNVVSLVAILFICVFSAYFVSDSGSVSSSFDFLLLVICSLSLQLFSQLYINSLLGMGYQFYANIAAASWLVFKALASIVAVVATSSLLVLLIIQLVIDCLFYFILVWILGKKFHDAESWKISDLLKIKSIFKYSLGVFSISCLYFVNSQFDKFFVVHYFDLADLGGYNLLFTVLITSSVLVNIIIAMLFPKFTQLFSDANIGVLRKLFSTLNVYIFLFLIVFFVFFNNNATFVLAFFIESKLILEYFREYGMFASIAAFFMTLQILPYEYLLAKGITNFNVKLLLFSSIASLSFSYCYIDVLGINAVLIALMVVNVLAYLFYAFYMANVLDCNKILLNALVVVVLFGCVLTMYTLFDLTTHSMANFLSQLVVMLIVTIALVKKAVEIL